MFGGLFKSICVPLASAGFGWLYFALAGLMAFALSFIGSVFTAQQQLFSAKDNDLLLAMPIPPAYILGSRMLMLYVLNLFMEILVIGPAGVIWWMNYEPSAVGILLFVVGSLVLPFSSHDPVLHIRLAAGACLRSDPQQVPDHNGVLHLLSCGVFLCIQ
jgi:ABC-2 type transport system permease protein